MAIKLDNKTKTLRNRPTTGRGDQPPIRKSGSGRKSARFDGNLRDAPPKAVVDFILASGGRSSEGEPRSRDIRPRRVDRPNHSDPSTLRFIDLFCGIGGFRLAFERTGAKCVFSSDWDRFSRQTYAANFGEEPWGDINTKPVAEIPTFDILCAGFPCQPFSLAGVSKKNSLGRKHGFEDERQGNLFFSIAAILDHHQPRAFVLENVKHLLRHDKGRTFAIIHDTLVKELGYQVRYKVIDAASVVPQHRERIFLVGFKPNRAFDFPKFPIDGPRLGSILERRVPEKYTLTDHLWNYLQNYARKHQEAGNGFGYGLVTRQDVARTLSARYHKDGSEILISQGQGKNPRRLTPRECANLMGYPPDFKIPVSDTQAYRQFGNSVVVPVIERIAKRLVESLYASPQNQSASNCLPLLFELLDCPQLV
ncbi:MAG: DNA (cytosine-5-)-methyltransferase [Phycisphaerales bacterium]|nr:DNA (cytosine-5-)-methyltransferase [Phycisphaerales bacterium]